MDKILTINNWKSLREVSFTPLNHIPWIISEYIESPVTYEYQINAGVERYYSIRIHRDLALSGWVRVSIWNDEENKLHSTGFIPLSEMGSLSAFKDALEGSRLK